MIPTETVLATFATPTAAEPTRLAVPSDLHLNLEQHGTWRVSHRTSSRLRAAVESWNDKELDAVVFVGDLVNDGTVAQYDAFDEILADLEHPFYAIPGNHDLIQREGTESLDLAEFERRYAPGPHPYHERIGGIDLLGVNSNQSTRGSITDTYRGRLEDDTLDWLERKLDTVEHPLVAVHHNLPGIRSLHDEAIEQLEVTGGSPRFENADEAEDAIAAGGSPLVITGHLHFPAVVTRQGVTEFTLPSLGPYPCGYTILDIDEHGTVATFHPVADFDGRVEAFVLGAEQTRVQLAAAQFAGLPLRDDRPCEG